MKVAPFAFALMMLSAPALAEEEVEFTFDFARPGMSRDEFRVRPWGEGVTALCSDDEARPRHVAALLDVPQAMAKGGAVRCGLFGDDGKLRTIDVAGQPSEVWGRFYTDGAGILRLVQLHLKQPRDGFEAMARYCAQRFGLPSERKGHFARWSNARNDLDVISDGKEALHTYLIDNRLQSLVNSRMGGKASRK